MLALIALNFIIYFVNNLNVLYKYWKKSFCEQTKKVGIAAQCIKRCVEEKNSSATLVSHTTHLCNGSKA